MKLTIGLTLSGNALIHLIIIVCWTRLCEERMRAGKRKVATILLVDNNLKGQEGYLKFNNRFPGWVMQRNVSARQGFL